jgi:hypothetical protein
MRYISNVRVKTLELRLIAWRRHCRITLVTFKLTGGYFCLRLLSPSSSLSTKQLWDRYFYWPSIRAIKASKVCGEVFDASIFFIRPRRVPRFSDFAIPRAGSLAFQHLDERPFLKHDWKRVVYRLAAVHGKAREARYRSYVSELGTERSILFCRVTGGGEMRRPD